MYVNADCVWITNQPYEPKSEEYGEEYSRVNI